MICSQVNGGKIVELIKKSAKKEMVSKIRAKCGLNVLSASIITLN